jgi:hypothetical protein
MEVTLAMAVAHRKVVTMAMVGTADTTTADTVEMADTVMRVIPSLARAVMNPMADMVATPTLPSQP